MMGGFRAGFWLGGETYHSNLVNFKSCIQGYT